MILVKVHSGSKIQENRVDLRFRVMLLAWAWYLERRVEGPPRISDVLLVGYMQTSCWFRRVTTHQPRSSPIRMSAVAVNSITDRTHLREIGRHNCTVRKFSSRKRFQGLGCRLHSIKLDEYLADTSRLSATASWSWDLKIKHLAVLAALILDILEDFCGFALACILRVKRFTYLRSHHC